MELNKLFARLFLRAASSLTLCRGLEMVVRLRGCFGSGLVTAFAVAGLAGASVAQTNVPTPVLKPLDEVQRIVDDAAVGLAQPGLMMCLLRTRGVPYSDLVEKLAQQYGERRRETEYLAPQAVAELWVDPEDGTPSGVLTLIATRQPTPVVTLKAAGQSQGKQQDAEIAVHRAFSQRGRSKPSALRCLDRINVTAGRRSCRAARPPQPHSEACARRCRSVRPPLSGRRSARPSIMCRTSPVAPRKSLLRLGLAFKGRDRALRLRSEQHVDHPADDFRVELLVKRAPTDMVAPITDLAQF
jgi:hypothetical protein